MKLARPLLEDDDDESKRQWQRSSGEQAARSIVERTQRLRVGLSSDEIDVGSIVTVSYTHLTLPTKRIV